MPHCGLRHSCCNARAAVRRARALELLESVHRPRMRAGLEVVPPTTGPGVVTLRKAQEFAERALGPRAPLGELKAAAVVRVRVPENLLAPREWRPPLRRAAGGAAQSAQHHQRCAQKPHSEILRHVKATRLLLRDYAARGYKRRERGYICYLGAIAIASLFRAYRRADGRRSVVVYS